MYHAHKDRESTPTAETYRDERFVAFGCLSLVNRETGVHLSPILSPGRARNNSCSLGLSLAAEQTCQWRNQRTFDERMNEASD